jgi:hypothetical protein
MLALYVISVIVGMMFAPLLVYEGLWVARWLMNLAAAFASRVAGRHAWSATVRRAQQESGGAGILPAVGYLSAAVGMSCWARRVTIARLLRALSVGWFGGAALGAFLYAGPVVAAWSSHEAGVLAVGMIPFLLAELVDPKITSRPKPRSLALAARSDSISNSSATLQLAATIGARGGVSALPAIRLDTSAAVNAISAVTASAGTVIAAKMSRTFADAVKPNLQPTIAALEGLTSAPFLKTSEAIGRALADAMTLDLSPIADAFRKVGTDAVLRMNLQPPAAALASFNAKQVAGLASMQALAAWRPPRLAFVNGPALEGS